MIKPKIKICGLRSMAIATQASTLGADMLGLIFHPTSKRVVSLEQATLLAATALQHGVSPVAVFVNQTATEMAAICTATGIQIVQLHGKQAREQQHLLPQHLRRIYVCNVTPLGEVIADDGWQDLDPTRDYLLYDALQAGMGELFNWQRFQPLNTPLKWGLAGGLNPANVAEALVTVQPDFVDAASGVESSEGQQDISLIHAFVQATGRRLI